MPSCKASMRSLRRPTINSWLPSIPATPAVVLCPGISLRYALQVMHRLPRMVGALDASSRVNHRYLVPGTDTDVGTTHVCAALCAPLLRPPMTYFGRWRMNRAAFWLRSSGQKIFKVASAVGYDSEVALSRAFKRLFGHTPGAYRRSCGQSSCFDSMPGGHRRARNAIDVRRMRAAWRNTAMTSGLQHSDSVADRLLRRRALVGMFIFAVMIVGGLAIVKWLPL